MSGIAGILIAQQEEPSEEELHLLSVALADRGPDDAGITVQQGLGLVHVKKASSFDPFDACHQPLSNHSKLTVLTDSQVMNYPDLKLKYQQSYPFTVGQEPEVLFPLYENFGIDFTQHLKGAFAIALYDGHSQEMILTRDESGLKPLYYAETPKGFYFASELKCFIPLLKKWQEDQTPPSNDLRYLTQEKPEILLNTQSLKEVLQFGAAFEKNTLLSSVFSVLPGETLVLHKGKIIKRQQKKPDLNYKINKYSLKKAKTRVRSKLCEVMTQNITSNPDMYCLLERPGDYILKDLLQKSYGSKVNTFSFSFGDEGVNDDASLKAQDIIPFGEGDFWRLLPFVASACDHPCFVPERVLLMKFMNYLSEGVSSLESNPNQGIGPIYGQPSLVYSGLGSKILFADLPFLKKAKRPSIFGGKLFPSQGVLSKLTDSPLFLSRWQEQFKGSVSEIAGQKHLSRLQKAQLLEYSHRFQSLHLHTYEQIVARTNFNVVFPFLEKEIFELVMTMPDSLKVHHGQGGYLLYEVLRDLSPGFDPLKLSAYKTEKMAQWFQYKASRLGALVSHQPEIESLFSVDFVRDAFTCRTDQKRAAAWTLLMFALWHQAHVIGVKPIPDTLAFLSAKS